jgi:hypothetical protein
MCAPIARLYPYAVRASRARRVPNIRGMKQAVGPFNLVKWRICSLVDDLLREAGQLGRVLEWRARSAPKSGVVHTRSPILSRRINLETAVDFAS